MDPKKLTVNLSKPVSRLDMIKQYCEGREVLDIGCVQHNSDNAVYENWLHGAIASVARRVVGVDYAEQEVEVLAKKGYNVVAKDVTVPFDLGDRFDIVVVGNLIEHLTNFEGFLRNAITHLKPQGRLLISTANPFYREQYFFSAFKNRILVNPEHTCWIDPVTLDQLVSRLGLETEEVWWVGRGWKLSHMILDGRAREFDMFTGKWVFHDNPGPLETVLSRFLPALFRAGFGRRKYTAASERYGAELPRYLYLRLVGMLFEAFWRLYRSLIITSPINRYELFLSVIRKDATSRVSDTNVASVVSPETFSRVKARSQ